MEFDADRHEARLAGCTVFEATSRRMRGLSIANFVAMNDLQHFSTEGRLVDDLPRYIAASIDQVTPELKKALAKAEREQTTQLFDTHPADNDRIRNARAEKTDGVMKLPETAERLRGAVLFRDIDRISRAATLDLYREMFNKKINAEKLASVDDLIERRNAEKEAAKSLLRYFQVEMPEFYPFPLSEQALEVPTDLKATAKRVKASRTEMMAALPKYRDTTEHFEFAEQAVVESTTALTVLDADLSLDYAEFRMQHPTREFAEFRLENAQTAVENLAAMMIDFETVAGARLTAALQILIHPEACKQVENGEKLREEMLRLIPTARQVSSLIGKLPSLRTNCMAMMTLISKLDGQVSQRTAEAIYERIERLHKQLTTLFKLLGDSPYPFDHSDESTTLRDFVLFDVPPMDELDAMVYMAQSSFERLISVQMRLFARLAQAAEAVETTLGMPLLPEPKPRKRRVDDDDDD